VTQEVECVIEEPGESKALVRVNMQDYVPALRRTPAQMTENIRQIDAFIEGVMRDGIDYGTIPGTQKPTLYKAGAERLLMAFGMGSTFELVDKIEDWKEGFFHYVYKASVGPIIDGGILPITSCEGSANSRERKWSRVNPPDVANTVSKMAQKRALVGAALIATNTSGRFTQDVEDLPPEMLRREQPQPAQPAQPAADGADFIWPAGSKHKGVRIGDIESQYLEWVVKNMDNANLNARASAELQRREAANA
jgi:hypothetical protein